jgi:peptidoglycan/LPS O-acetylase OafA/YrhL
MGRWHIARLPRFAAPQHTGKSERSTVLDGLRGWASLSVVCYHVFWETFGLVRPEFKNPVTGFLFDGALAVSIFFVLSGEALSAAFFAGKGKLAVIKLAIKRYPRLTIPILATCLITFALSRTDMLFNAEAGMIVGRPDWMGSWVRFSFGLPYVLRYACVSVYTTSDAATALNAFLWTMRLELVGSVIVFAILLTFGRFRLAWLMLAALTLLLGWLTPTHDLACFTVGIAFAAARSHGVFDRIQRMSIMPPVCWTVIAAVGIGDGLMQWEGLGPKGTALFFAVPLVLAIFCDRTACCFFTSAASRLLGRVSFPLYLVQFPVLVSFTSGAIVYAAHHGGLRPAIVYLIAGSSVVICLVAAVLFEPVEIFTRWFGQRLVEAALAAWPRLIRDAGRLALDRRTQR